MPIRLRSFYLAMAASILLPQYSCKHAPTAEENNNGSEVKFAQGLGGASHGHEKLTELATKMANQALNPALGERPVGFRRVLPWHWGSGQAAAFFPEAQIEQPAYRNSHPMTWGSLSADFPPSTRGVKISVTVVNGDRDTTGDKMTFLNYMLCKHYRLTGTSGIPAKDLRTGLEACDKMPTSGEYQDVHFLRRWSGATNLETGKQACFGGQQRVRQATIQALQSWQTRHHAPDDSVDGDRYPHFMGLYFVGLAMHTVQDAFSGAHVDRDLQNRRVIKRICHYNGEVIEKNLHTDVCRHKVPFDPRDLIWQSNAVGHFTATKYVTAVVSGFLNRVGGEFNDLTPDAQGAVMASMAYLLTFTRILSELPAAADGGLLFSGTEGDLAVVDQELESFFNFDGDAGNDPRLEGSGYLNCNRLVEKI